jgi:hypothetical protein
MCRSDLDFLLSISNSHVQQSAYSSSSKMRSPKNNSSRLYDGRRRSSSERQSGRDCTKTAYFLFRLTLSECTYRRSTLPVSLYKHEIILKVALVRCPASELSSSFLFTCFHSTLVGSDFHFAAPRRLRPIKTVKVLRQPSQVHGSSMRQ